MVWPATMTGTGSQMSSRLQLGDSVNQMMLLTSLPGQSVCKLGVTSSASEAVSLVLLAVLVWVSHLHWMPRQGWFGLPP